MSLARGFEPDQPLSPYAIIGAGPVALAIAQTLTSLSQPPALILSRSLPSASAVASSLPNCSPSCATLHSPPNAPHIVSLIICLSDGVLATPSALAHLTSAFPNAKVALHTSGALSAQVLTDLAPHVLAFHPATPFPRAPALPGVLKGAIASMQATSAPSLAFGRALAALLDMPVLTLPNGARAKTRYHAACCMAANYTAVGVVAALEVLRAQGSPGPDSGLMADLVEALASRAAVSVGDALRAGAHVGTGLTGPVSRGDSDAVAAHVAALGGSGDDCYQLPFWVRRFYGDAGVAAVAAAKDAGRFANTDGGEDGEQSQVTELLGALNAGFGEDSRDL